MKKSKRLTKILDLAVDNERDAAKAFAECRQQLDSRTEQLEELQSLHNEYVQQIKTKGETGLDAGKLRDYWAFVERLSRAVTQQMQFVSQSEKLVDSKRGTWSKRRAHARAMEELVARHRAREKREAVRRMENDAEDPGNRGRQNPRPGPSKPD